MLRKLGRILEDIIDDLGYFFKRGSAFILGKAGGEVAGLAIAGPVLGLLASFAGFDVSGTTATFLATAVAAAAVAGVSVGLVQTDFLHRRGHLVDRYREEAGALLSKAPDKVTEQDMELIARGDFKRSIDANPTIREELRNSRLDRNVNVILSTLVAVTTFLTIKIFDPAGVHDVLGHGLESIVNAVTQNTGQLVVGLGLNGLAGFGIYHALKTPLHWLAEHVLGIEENTINNQITDIKRTLGHGHEVAPEQVLGVFVSAHPDIAAQLKAEYGKSFEEMQSTEKQQILSILQQHVDIAGLTTDINKGRLRPEELAFISFGQNSGVGRHADGTYKQNGNIIDGMWRGLSSVTNHFHTPARPTTHQELTSYVGQMPGETTYTVHSPSPDDSSLQVENQYEEPGRKQSFVARVGRKVSDDGLTHVERLHQSSSQEVLVTR